MSTDRMDAQTQFRDRRDSGISVQSGQNLAGVVTQLCRPSRVVNDYGQPTSFESFGLRMGRDGLTDGRGPAVVEVDRATPRTEAGSHCFERIADRPWLAATPCVTASRDRVHMLARYAATTSPSRIWTWR